MKEKYMEYIAYAVLIGGLLFAWAVENKDIHCPNLWHSTKEQCENGGGMAFAWSKPLPTDTCQQLLEKIKKAAGAEQASVKWRKALVLSIMIMVTMWILVGFNKTESGFPDWRILYLSIAVCYIIILGSYLYYSYHVFKNPEDWIKESVKQLEKQGCIK